MVTRAASASPSTNNYNNNINIIYSYNNKNDNDNNINMIEDRGKRKSAHVTWDSPPALDGQRISGTTTYNYIK